MHPSFEAPQVDPPRDDRKDEAGLGDALDVADMAYGVDSCAPGWLDLGCFDVSDCGLDCVPFDCSL